MCVRACVRARVLVNPFSGYHRYLLAIVLFKMDPNWETYLRHQLPSVVQVLRPKMLADRLYADRLLNKTEYEDLTHSADSQENKARRMLLMLQRRGPGSFDQFCDVLQQVDGQKFIEEMLRPYIDRSRDSVLSEPARPSPAVVEREDRHEEDEQVASPAESMHESITGSAGHLAIVVEGSVSAEVNKQIMEVSCSHVTVAVLWVWSSVCEVGPCACGYHIERLLESMRI